MKTPARAQLGRRYAGQPIGYRVLSLDGKTVAPFTREGVRESQPGHYMAVVDGPEAGGWIVWGTPGNPSIAEAELPAQPPAVDLSPLQEAVDGLVARLIEALPEPAAPLVDTAPFLRALDSLQSNLLSLAESERSERSEVARTMIAGMDDLRAGVHLVETAGEVERLREAAGRFVELSDAATKMIAANTGIADLGVTIERMDRLRADMSRLHEATLNERKASTHIETEQRRALELVDEFLAKLETA